MSLIAPKQLNLLLGTQKRAVNAFTLSTSSTATVTTSFSGKVAGGNNSSAGVVTTAPDNKVNIVSKTTGKAIDNGSGVSVYGRLVQSTGVWTVAFYVMLSGVETVFTFPAGHVSLGQAVDVIYVEIVQVKDLLPLDTVNGLDNIDELSTDTRTHQHYTEAVITPTAGQTAFTLTNTPRTGSLEFSVNGVDMTMRVTYASTSLTYVATDFALDILDKVSISYDY
jgi:hypothetical protein